MIIEIKGLHSQCVDKLLIPFKRAGWDWAEDEYFNQIKLVKDCESWKQAITEFERISGFSVLDEGQCGDTIFDFSCKELQMCISGWEALKYIYDKWYATPRECLVALNTNLQYPTRVRVLGKECEIKYAENKDEK